MAYWKRYHSAWPHCSKPQLRASQKTVTSVTFLPILEVSTAVMFKLTLQKYNQLLILTELVLSLLLSALTVSFRASAINNEKKTA
jgi:hypothetical protein